MVIVCMLSKREETMTPDRNLMGLPERKMWRRPDKHGGPE